MSERIAIPRQRYVEHANNARARKIAFLLTFDDWLGLWLQSGKWAQRGSRRGQYVMARPGDQGAYEIGNVVICLAEENRAERNRNYPLKGRLNGAYGQDYWARLPVEKRRERQLKVAARFAGEPKSLAQRAAMAVTAIGRKRVWRNGRAAWAHLGDLDFPRTY